MCRAYGRLNANGRRVKSQKYCRSLVYYLYI
jgi:hypothetical protein